jgi:hypothetical protein
MKKISPLRARSKHVVTSLTKGSSRISEVGPVSPHHQSEISMLLNTKFLVAPEQTTSDYNEDKGGSPYREQKQISLPSVTDCETVMERMNDDSIYSTAIMES